MSHVILFSKKSKYNDIHLPEDVIIYAGQKRCTTSDILFTDDRTMIICSKSSTKGWSFLGCGKVVLQCEGRSANSPPRWVIKYHLSHDIVNLNDELGTIQTKYITKKDIFDIFEKSLGLVPVKGNPLAIGIVEMV
jgi:hypothetical protein